MFMVAGTVRLKCQCVWSECSEELNREQNKDLKGFVDKLAGVKQIIDDKGKIAGALPVHLLLHGVGGTHRPDPCPDSEP